MNTKGLWIGLGIAAAAGAIIAALYAPGGEARRRKLAGAFEESGEYLADAVDFLKDRAEHLGQDAGSAYETTAKAVSEVASEAAEGIQDAVSHYAESAAKLTDLSKSMV